MADSKPIPIRFDGATAKSLKKLADRTDTSQAELVRRAVQYALDLVERTGEISFLFDRQHAGIPVDRKTPLTVEDFLKAINKTSTGNALNEDENSYGNASSSGNKKAV